LRRLRSLMQLVTVVEVDYARVSALTPEAFRLVLEARGWVVEGDFATLVNPDGTAASSAQLSKAAVQDHSDSPFRRLAQHYHNGATFAAFAEVERVQALLNAVEAAERGEWDRAGEAEGMAGSCIARVCKTGRVVGSVLRRSVWLQGEPFVHPCGPTAAREARAQLPRLVRIICGVK